MLKKKKKREKKDEGKKPHPTNLKHKLIGRAIRLTIDTAKYYMNESGNSDIIVGINYKKNIDYANNYIFNKYLKLSIFELLRYILGNKIKEIYNGINANGKIFFDMKFETFLFKKGFPFSKDKLITESLEEKNLNLPEIKFSLPECKGVYLDKFNKQSKSLKSENTEEFLNKIEGIKKNWIFSVKKESNTNSSLMPDTKQITEVKLKNKPQSLKPNNTKEFKKKSKQTNSNLLIRDKIESSNKIPLQFDDDLYLQEISLENINEISTGETEYFNNSLSNIYYPSINYNNNNIFLDESNKSNSLYSLADERKYIIKNYIK